MGSLPGWPEKSRGSPRKHLRLFIVKAMSRLACITQAKISRANIMIYLIRKYLTSEHTGIPLKNVRLNKRVSSYLLVCESAEICMGGCCTSNLYILAYDLSSVHAGHTTVNVQNSTVKELPTYPEKCLPPGVLCQTVQILCNSSLLKGFRVLLPLWTL